ncbi:Rho-binding antiterminator [Klebsiella pneumoniae]|nr:Rho-binding antiterminator [Klebsiella pneumoniae]
MSMNDTYQPINCDDYDNLELACQHHLVLTLALKDGEQLQAKASDLISRKNIEYLVVELVNGNVRELRLDKIASFSHPEIGTVVVSES